MNVNVNTRTMEDNTWAPPTGTPQVAANRSAEDIELWQELTARLMEIGQEYGWNKAEVARRIGMPSGSFGGWYSGNVGEGRLDNNNAKVAKPNTAAPVVAGDIKYKDLNGDGKVDMNNDREILGSQFPKLTYDAQLGAGCWRFRHRHDRRWHGQDGDMHAISQAPP